MIGPSRQFPKGKLNEDDQGELTIGVATDKEKKTVIINFGKRVAWIGLPAEGLKIFINILQDKLKGIEKL